MRYILLSAIVLSVLIVGCAPKQPEYAVGLYNFSNEDIVENNKTVTLISFTLQNQETFSLDCEVFLTVESDKDQIKKKGKLENITPQEFRKGRFKVFVPEGDSRMDLTPICSPVNR